MRGVTAFSLEKVYVNTSLITFWLLKKCTSCWPYGSRVTNTLKKPSLEIPLTQRKKVLVHGKMLVCHQENLVVINNNTFAHASISWTECHKIRVFDILPAPEGNWLFFLQRSNCQSFSLFTTLKGLFPKKKIDIMHIKVECYQRTRSI